MLTKLTIRNFKRFGEEVNIELGNPVLFIGPNNSGKTTAMQALALWDIGLRRWNEKWAGKSAPEKRPGVTINRRDLVSIPVPAADQLWHDLRTREARKKDETPGTNNIRIEIIVEGVTNGKSWTCGLEFDYANKESFYCRPLRISEDNPAERMPVPDRDLAGAQQIAFLPPMSGLAATEIRLDRGAVDVRIGEGRTAEVLRNLCYRVHEDSSQGVDSSKWDKLVDHMYRLFGVKLHSPQYIPERGEIEMAYHEPGRETGRENRRNKNVELDLSSAGRGLQQTLLLLAYMYANPGAVLLLDEPDAHLEILRQRQTYKFLVDVARESGSQIIAASHSEVLLNEAAGRDLVIACVGRPHRIDDRGSQLLKALKDIGFEQFLQAEQTGWVLYLEGSTDLSILQAFARRLRHEEASRALERPFVKYVGNQPTRVQDHFHGLLEACPELLGIALFDRIETSKLDIKPIECLMWKRREIENYICSRATLEAYAAAPPQEIELGQLQTGSAMHKAMDRAEEFQDFRGTGSPWGPDIKSSTDVLEPIFRSFFESLSLPNLMAKKSFYELVDYVPVDEIDPEVSEKLDAIARVAQLAEDDRKH